MRGLALIDGKLPLVVMGKLVEAPSFIILAASSGKPPNPAR